MYETQLTVVKIKLVTVWWGFLYSRHTVPVNCENKKAHERMCGFFLRSLFILFVSVPSGIQILTGMRSITCGTKGSRSCTWRSPIEV